jgi:hypothetical protein
MIGCSNTQVRDEGVRKVLAAPGMCSNVSGPTIDADTPVPVRMPALPWTPRLQRREQGATSSGAAAASSSHTPPVLPPAQPRVEPATSARRVGQSVVAPGSGQSGEGTPQVGGKSAHSTLSMHVPAVLQIVLHWLRRSLLYVILICYLP